jgi:hypothetical protein
MSFKKALICFLLVGSGIALCQDAPVPPVQNTEGPSVKALILSQESASLEVVSINANKQISPPITISASGPSVPFFPGRSFHLAIQDSKADTGYRSVASVQLPEEGTEFIVLLEPNEAKVFTPHVVNSRQSNFRGDSVLFFNFSDTSVGVVMDAKKAVLGPKKVEIVSAPPMTGDIPYYDVVFYYPDGDKTRAFGSSRWLHRTDGRNYAFVFKERTSGRFGVKILDEGLSDN